jgi:hypothetical protein
VDGRRGWLRTNDIGGIERVIGIRLTFTGKGMEGDRLVRDIVHRKEGRGSGGGVGERDSRAKGERGGYITRGETHGTRPAIAIGKKQNNYYLFILLFRT